MNSGIYKITNKSTQKFYIGSSINIKSRLNKHRYHLKNNTHHSDHLQRSYNKYGKEKFVFEILEEISILKNETKEQFKKRLVEGREQYYLDTLKPWDPKIGYNVYKFANSSKDANNETIKKCIISKLGNKNPMYGKIPWNKNKKTRIGGNKINHKEKSINQYTTNNKLIKKWNSSHEIFEIFGWRHIGEVCDGYRKSAHGYIWSWA